VKVTWSNYRQKLRFSALFAVAFAALPICAADVCPEQIGTLSGGPASSVHVSGSYAYVDIQNGSHRLAIVDVSNPASPVELGSYPVVATETLVIGGLAYVVSTNGALPGLFIIDVSDPLNPTLVSATGTGAGGFDVQVVGSYAYIVTRGSSPGDGLRVLDVSNPVTPVDVGGYDLPHAESLAVAYPYAYVVVATHAQAGLHVHIQ